MSEDFQIGGNLSKEEGRRLKAYAEGLQLTRPNLCALLVVRELACGRLASLRTAHAGSEPKRGAARVTVRVSEEAKSQFRTAAAGAGLGLDDAAAILFRAELEERWLERSVGTP